MHSSAQFERYIFSSLSMVIVFTNSFSSLNAYLKENTLSEHHEIIR